MGRPRVDQEIEALVIRMARENRSWGYDRMQGAVKHLGYPISNQTVGTILKCHRLSPAPERKKTVTWREFIRIHLDVLLATDCFTSDVWSWLRLLVSCLLHVIHWGRHHVCSVSHQTIQAMRSLVRHALELGTYGSSGRCFVNAWARSPVIRGEEGVLGTAVSAWISRDKRRPRFHATGKVVFLALEHPRKIRYGPLPARQRLKESGRDEHRQAA